MVLYSIPIPKLPSINVKDLLPKLKIPKPKIPRDEMRVLNRESYVVTTLPESLAVTKF